MLGGAELGLSPPSSPRSPCGRLCTELHAPTPMASCPSLPTRLGWALGVGGAGGETSLRGAFPGGKPHPLYARADPASEVEKPHTNQGQLGPPSASAPSARLPSQTEESQRAVGEWVWGVRVWSQGGSFWEPRMCEISPSCAPQREGLNGVINHFPEWSCTP